METSKKRYRIPVNFASGRGPGFLELAALKSGPALLSNKSAKRLGLIIDTERDRAFSRALNCEIRMRTTEQGHYVIDLLGSLEQTQEDKSVNLLTTIFVDADDGETPSPPSISAASGSSRAADSLPGVRVDHTLSIMPRPCDDRGTDGDP